MVVGSTTSGRPDSRRSNSGQGRSELLQPISRTPPGSSRPRPTGPAGTPARRPGVPGTGPAGSPRPAPTSARQPATGRPSRRSGPYPAGPVRRSAPAGRSPRPVRPVPLLPRVAPQPELEPGVLHDAVGVQPQPDQPTRAVLAWLRGWTGRRSAGQPAVELPAHPVGDGRRGEQPIVPPGAVQ